MNNTKNSNKEFQDFYSCDLKKHWSWSNFNRHIITCNALSKLREKSVVVEFGAGDSPVSDMLRRNFGRYDIAYVKTDCEEVAEKDDALITFDLNKCDEKKLRNIIAIETGKREADAIVLCEVIEHLEDISTIYKVLEMCYNVLDENGVLILSTPTPPFNGHYEDRVWPDDHKFELGKNAVEKALNRYFKIDREVGWSLEERDYNKLLEEPEYAVIYTRMRERMPEGFIRALLPMMLKAGDIGNCRQITFVCRKRREVSKVW